MSKSLLSFLLLAVATASTAVALDPYTRISTAKIARDNKMQASLLDNEEASKRYRSVIIRVDESLSVDKLEEMGVKIMRMRDDLAACAVPEEMLSQLETSRGVCNMQLSRPVDIHLDKARAMTGVDALHKGTNDFFHLSLDGTGTLVGFSDTGFDHGHIAFGNRVKGITHYDISTATRYTALTPTEIRNWDTDSRDNYHATHVAGILAGGHTMLPLHGVAPGADIFATTSHLSDTGILCGVEDIIDYGKSMGLTPVINLSLGQYLGPHDGTDLFSQYLDKCAQDAVICLSSGNYAMLDIYIGHVFKPASDGTSAEVLSSCLNSIRTWDGRNVGGMVDMWSDDGTPFEVHLCIYDPVTHDMVYRSPAINEDCTYFEASSDTDTEMARYLTGYMAIAAERNPENGRWNCTALVDVDSPEIIEPGNWGRYYAAFEVHGVPGKKIDIFADGSGVYFQALNGYTQTAGTHDFSISNMACGHNTICVGAASSRNKAVLKDGTPISWDFETDRIASFSSYGTLADGRSLPHIAAPGNMVISAVSQYYIDAHPNAIKTITHSLIANNRNNVYYPECGTSMASPHAAGIAALWLQAFPETSPEDIRQNMIATAQTDYPDIASIAWGAGCIDAVEGLRRLVTLHGVTDIATDQNAIYLVSANNGQITVEMLDGRHARVTISDTAGRNIQSLEASPIAASAHLTPGIYIVDIQGIKTLKVRI